MNFNQDNINKLTDYIFKDEKLRVFAAKEDWKSLFKFLYRDKSSNYEKELSFLYHYFL